MFSTHALGTTVFGYASRKHPWICYNTSHRVNHRFSEIKKWFKENKYIILKTVS